MFRLWAKIWKSGRMTRDMVVCNDDQELNRTRKIFVALEEVCKDNFMDEIDFDYLDIQVIEEDDHE